MFKFLVLKLITKLFSKHRAVERSNVGLTKALVIGVLYSYKKPSNHEVVQRFIRDLKNLDKKVSVLCYTTEQEHFLYPSSHLLYAFNHKAITAFGRITNDRVRTFIHTPFDYLFHVDMDTNALLDYIVANNQSKCRVGHFDAGRKQLFEVMVKVKQTCSIENIKRLTSQMLHYTGCMES